MLRLTLVLRLTTHLLPASALILTMGALAHAAPIMINNGLAPPNPENVIDGADDYSGTTTVYVRNVGCPPGWPAVLPDDPCPSPGAATEVGIVSGGDLWYMHSYDSSTVTMSGGTGQALWAYDSSTLTMSGGSVGTSFSALDSANVTMSGGTVGSLYAYDSSNLTLSGGTVGSHLQGDLWVYGDPTVTISGGTVRGNLYADDSPNITIDGGAIMYSLWALDAANVTMSGGTVGGSIRVQGSSIITFVGSDFMVNDELVPYGDLSAVSGRLTGTLALSGSLDNAFSQGGAYPNSGTIRLVLVPEPSTALLLGFGLTALAASRRRCSREGLTAETARELAASTVPKK